MNVGSSSAGTAAVASSNNSSSVQASKASSKSSSETSFEDEMKNVSSSEKEQNEKETVKEVDSKDENNAEDKDNSQVKNDDKTNADIKGEVSKNNVVDSEELLAQNIKAIINTNKEISQVLNSRQNIANFAEVANSLSTKIDYNTFKMDDNDALFFANLVQNTDMSMQSVASEIKNLAEVSVQEAQKTANVSATLMKALHESVKTNQPFRIDFDKDISVIIKVNKDGSIAANFIPGDKAVEEYLKMNISSLKQRFEQEDISYSDLSYSRSKQQQEQQENNKRKNKENGHE